MRKTLLALMLLLFGTAALASAGGLVVGTLAGSSSASILGASQAQDGRVFPGILVVSDGSTDQGAFTVLKRWYCVVLEERLCQLSAFSGATYTGPGLSVSLRRSTTETGKLAVFSGIYYVSKYTAIDEPRVSVGIFLSYTW